MTVVVVPTTGSDRCDSATGTAMRRVLNVRNAGQLLLCLFLLASMLSALVFLVTALADALELQDVPML